MAVGIATAVVVMIVAVGVWYQFVRDDNTAGDGSGAPDGGSVVVYVPDATVTEGDVVTFGYEIVGIDLTEARLILDGVVVDTAADPGDLRWTAQAGTHRISLEVRDENGERTVSTAAELTVVGGPPTTSTAAPVASPIESSKLTASASSTLTGAGELTYDASNVLDDDPATAWNHDSGSAEAVGSWLRFELGTSVRLDRLVITNGYVKNTEVFQKNHRAQDVTIEVFRADTVVWSTETRLADSPDPQDVAIGYEGEADAVRIVIRSIYPGSEWDDLAISDVDIWQLS